jgi:two-component sensor histidine kinase
MSALDDFLHEPAQSAEARISPQTIVAEAHHRISNNLSMIALLSRAQANELSATETFSSDEVRAMLTSLATKIETVLCLHRLLSDKPAEEMPDLGNYLAEVALSIISSMCLPHTKPRFTAELRSCAVAADEALCAGMIVNELVTNSIKYAHPAGFIGEIRLGCRQTGSKTLVEVSDDGVGFPEGFDPQTGGGLGLRLVRSLAATLNAKLVFEQSDLGLRTRLEIPKTEAQASRRAAVA